MDDTAALAGAEPASPREDIRRANDGFLWSRTLIEAYAAERWRADRVVAEANQGGAMIETVLRAIERDLPLKLRHAREAKGKRAEPVAALF